MGARIRANVEPGVDEAKVKSFVVTTLESRSRFKQAGVQVGDNILRINGTLVKGLTLSALKQLLILKKGQSAKVILEVQAKGTPTTRTLELDASPFALENHEGEPNQ